MTLFLSVSDVLLVMTMVIGLCETATSVSGVEGQTLTLSCTNPSGGGPFRWIKGKRSDPSDKLPRIIVYQDVTATPTTGDTWKGDVQRVTPVGSANTSIEIKLKHPRDDGYISCEKPADGLDKQVTHVIYDVTVYVPPTILSYKIDGETVNNNTNVILRDDKTMTLTVTFNSTRVARGVLTVWDGQKVVASKAYNDVKNEIVHSIEKVLRSWHGMTLIWRIYNDDGSMILQNTIIVHYGPDIVLTPPGSAFTVKEHTRLEIKATVTSRPAYTSVEWVTDNNKLVSSNSTLLFESIKRTDSGSYKVVALIQEIKMTKSKNINIVVLYPPSVVMNVTKEGTLTCTATPGNPPSLTYSFIQTVAGKKVRTVNYTRIAGSLKAVAQYNPMLYEDKGVYTCVVRNTYKGDTVGKGTASLQVDTQSEPFFIDNGKVFLIGINESDEVAMKFFSVPKYTTTEWQQYRNGNLTSLSKNSTDRLIRKTTSSLPFHGLSVTTDVYEFVLMIRKTTFTEAGIYRFRVSVGNKVGSLVSQWFNVTVIMGSTQTTTPAASVDSAVIGGAIGGVLILIVLVVVAVLVWRHLRRKDAGVSAKHSKQNLTKSDDHIEMEPNDIYESGSVGGVLTTAPAKSTGHPPAVDDQERLYATAAKVKNGKPKPVDIGQENIYSTALKSSDKTDHKPVSENEEVTYSSPLYPKVTAHEDNVYEKAALNSSAGQKKTPVEVTYSSVEVVRADAQAKPDPKTHEPTEYAAISF